MEYQLDRASLAQQLEDLDRRRWLFEHLPLDPVHLEWFRHRAWVRTIHGTTKIEGNTLSDVQVEELLGGTALPVSRREALEILGSRSAIQFADELADQLEVPVNESVVREIHRRVLEDIDPMLTPGEYRRGENRVIDAGGNTIFSGPPSGDVPELMREFGAWAGSGADQLPAPMAAAVAHLEFVAIHPFNDGNGRTARALARLLLARGGFGFGGLVSLDGQLDQERIAYFAAIAESTGRRYEPGYDSTRFVNYFLGATTRAADRVLDRMRALGKVQIAIRRTIVAERLAPRLLDGLAYAWINYSIRPADYSRITGRSPQGATRDLASAAAQGYLEPRGATRTRRYLLGPELRSIVDAPEA